MEKSKSMKKFMIIWTGELIASIGSGMTAFALGVYVFKMTNSAVCVSLVTLAAFLPSILLSPIAGVMADRFDRRLLMMIGDGCSAIGLLFILIAMKSGNVQFWHICVGVAISSVFTALLEPSYKATISDLLTEDEFAKASGLVQLAGASKYLCSPVLAGFLLTITNVEVILMIDIGTLFITVMAVFTVRKGLQKIKASSHNQNLVQDFKEGWKTVIDNKGVFNLIVIMSLITFYIGFVQTLMTPLFLSFSNEKTLGIVESVAALGMLVSSMLIGMFDISKKYVKELMIALAMTGLTIVLMGLKENVYFITISAFLFFATLPFINTSAEVLIRKSIPNEKQGRAWGIIGIISQLGYVVAYAISGFLADHVFNPLLVEGGSLSRTVGTIIGVGSGRGIGLLFIIAGIFIVLIAVLISKSKSIRILEEI